MADKKVLVGDFEHGFPVHRPFDVDSDRLLAPNNERIILQKEFNSLAGIGTSAIERDSDGRVFRVTSVVEGVNKIATYTYDSSGNVSQIDVVYGDIHRVYTMVRDDDGNVSQITVS